MCLSCVLRSTGRGSNWRITVPAWWFPGEHHGWESIVDDVAWMNQISDLPDVRSFIEISNPRDNSQWYAIDGFYHWEQPTPAEEERSDLTRKEFFYILTSYLIHKDDYDEFYNWALEQDFMGRWMPEGPELYEIFLGEFYWSRAYLYHTDPYEREIGRREGDLDSRIPKQILPLVATYIQGDRGFDCSIDNVIGITVPTQLLAERMGLSWNGHEGKYFDKAGKLAVFDPSVDENGPSTLLIQKEAFSSFLQESNYCVVWTLLAEKQLIGGGYRHDEWKGRLEISGVYRLVDGKVQGQLTPRFRSPQNRV